jgi:hypothetical protein
MNKYFTHYRTIVFELHILGRKHEVKGNISVCVYLLTYTSLFTKVLFSEFNTKFLTFVMFMTVIDGLNNSLINKTESTAFQLCSE